MSIQWVKHGLVSEVSSFEFMELQSSSDTENEHNEFMSELEHLDSNPLYIPVKILKRYLHHFSPANLIRVFGKLNPLNLIKTKQVSKRFVPNK